MTDDLMRRMRDHVGYDPERIVSGEQPASRAERRAAERVLGSRIKASEFKPCGHSALGCYNDAGACCKNCDHGTYWRALHSAQDHLNGGPDHG